MRSPLSLSKIRLYIFVFAAAILVWWVYAHYFQQRPVRVAVTAAESALLIESAVRNNAEHIEFVESDRSPADRDLVRKGEADLAVIQGGIRLPDNFNVMGVVRTEHILFLVRSAFPPAGREPPHVITFTEGQGSQILGKVFLELWGYPTVEWIHSWERIAADENYAIPSDAHAIFVVIDPADPTMQKAIRRVAEAG
jgi:hypothetical protein